MNTLESSEERQIFLEQCENIKSMRKKLIAMTERNHQLVETLKRLNKQASHIVDIYDTGNIIPGKCFLDLRILTSFIQNEFEIEL